MKIMIHKVLNKPIYIKEDMPLYEVCPKSSWTAFEMSLHVVGMEQELVKY